MSAVGRADLTVQRGTAAGAQRCEAGSEAGLLTLALFAGGDPRGGHGRAGLSGIVGPGGGLRDDADDGLGTCRDGCERGEHGQRGGRSAW